MYFNYVNDDFYSQWYHQWFFSFTELTSTFIILYLANRKHTASPPLLLVIINIAILHILVAGGDQFVANVLDGQGEWFQNSRDIGFMLPDLFNIILPLWEWNLWASNNGVTMRDSLDRWVLLASVVSIGILWAICRVL